MRSWAAPKRRFESGCAIDYEYTSGDGLVVVVVHVLVVGFEVALPVLDRLAVLSRHRFDLDSDVDHRRTLPRNGHAAIKRIDAKARRPEN